jgi:hypothetical protein
VSDDALAPASGLMVFWADIAPENQREYQRWHNTEHMPERVALPGFLLGRRYRDLGREDRFLMCYDTTGAQALQSPAYLHALDHPTPLTRRALAWFRDPLRSVYTLEIETASRSASAPAAPVLVAARYEALGAVHAAGLQAAFASVAGLRRAASYRLDAAGSRVRTDEARIHQARAQDAGGLLWAEYDDLGLLDDPAARQSLDESVRGWAQTCGVAGLEPCRVLSIDFECRPASAAALPGSGASATAAP